MWIRRKEFEELQEEVRQLRYGKMSHAEVATMVRQHLSDSNGVHIGDTVAALMKHLGLVVVVKEKARTVEVVDPQATPMAWTGGLKKE
jgi:hypothetical protein